MLYAPLDLNTPKLRIGVMLDRFEVPAWIAGILSEIANSDIAELTVAILNDTPVAPAEWTIRGIRNSQLLLQRRTSNIFFQPAFRFVL
jgi:hypothetical protein